MYISAVNNVKASNRTSFGVGKSYLYSDFDCTYMPFSHKDMCAYDSYKNNPQTKEKFDCCFGAFGDFLSKFGDKFNFTITTGRNRPEFNHFMSKLEKQGAELPKPDKLITCDGKDIFYKKDGFYPRESLDSDKRGEMEKILHWIPNSILPQMKEILASVSTNDGKPVSVIETPVNENEVDYEENSLQYTLRSTEGLRDGFASFNEGYDFSPFIVLSANADIDEAKKKLDDLFQKSGINADVSLCYDEWNVGDPNPYQSISVRVQGNEGFWTDRPLNKLYDTHKKAEEIYKNKSDDLVIVSGDSDNDEDMLNIFNYVDILGLDIPEKGNYEEFMANPENRELIRQLPIVFVVVGKNPDLDLIRDNDRLLSQYGIRKTVFVDYNEDEILLDGVKQAMNIYSEENENFKNGLGSGLLKQIA